MSNLIETMVGDCVVFSMPEVDNEPPSRHISVGAFFDRFGAQKYPILASSDAGVKALITDCSVRKYIDLDNEELPFGLQLLVDAVFAVDINAILNDVITDQEKP